MKMLYINVDTNDADYVTAITTITEKDLDKIMPLIQAIKKSKTKYGHNYSIDMEEENVWELDGKDIDAPIGGMAKQYPKVSVKVHELFYDHCPSTEHGFHTIESIEVYPIPEKKRLL